MDEALKLPVTGHKRREIQYRDGLLLALLSSGRYAAAASPPSPSAATSNSTIWGVNILLHPSDTKAKRPESFRVPEPILPYLRRYLEEIRPRLLGRCDHDGLWASYQGRPLSGGRIYDIARARVFRKIWQGHGTS